MVVDVCSEVAFVTRQGVSRGLQKLGIWDFACRLYNLVDRFSLSAGRAAVTMTFWASFDLAHPL